MRLWLAALLATALVPTMPLARDFDEGAMCDSPPCSRAELERYERGVIRHALRANALAAEALSRGEKQEAIRLRKVFERSRDRRAEIRKAIERTSD